MSDQPKPEPTNLIAFLTAPLKKLEHHERAQEVLVEVVEDQDLPPGPRHHLWLIALAWLVAVIALGGAIKAYIDREAGWSLSAVMGIEAMEMPILLDTDAVSEDDKLLLGQGEGNREEQAKLLHEKHPEDAFYYLHHAYTHFEKFNKLPEGYLETVARIDSQNSLPLYYAAGMLKAKALEEIWVEHDDDEERIRDGVNLSPRLRAEAYEILDQEAYDEAVQRLEQATAIEGYRRHHDEFIMRAYHICESLEGRDHLFGAVSALLLMWSGSHVEFQLKNAADLLEMEAILAVEAEDQERFLEVVAMRDRMIARQADHEPLALLSPLIYKAIGESTATQLLAASEALGLKVETERFQREVDGFQEHRDERRYRSKKGIGIPSFEKSGALTRVMLPVVMVQSVERVPIAQDEYKPMRLTEHAKVRQKCTQVSMLGLLVLSVAAILLRFLFPRAIGIPASRCVQLLNHQDWLWIFGGGVLGPLLIGAGLWQLPAYNGEAYGIMAMGFAFPILPASCLFMTLLLTPLIFIQWRLGLCLGLQNTASPWSKPLIGALLILLITPPVAYQASSGKISGDEYLGMQTLLYAGPIMCVLLLALFGWGLWRLFRHEAQGRFRLVAVATALHPCLLIALALLSLSLPFQYRAESRWLAQDTLVTPDASKPGMGLYENRVARQVYKEANAILFPDGE